MYDTFMLRLISTSTVLLRWWFLLLAFAVNKPRRLTCCETKEPSQTNPCGNWIIHFNNRFWFHELRLMKHAGRWCCLSVIGIAYHCISRWRSEKLLVSIEQTVYAALTLFLHSETTSFLKVQNGFNNWFPQMFLLATWAVHYCLSIS